MIIAAEIIVQPISGSYPERIYSDPKEHSVHFNTWVKFTNSDGTEWCGQFYGFPKRVAISEKHDSVLLLTSYGLFQLDRHSADIIAIDTTTNCQDLTVTPFGDVLLVVNFFFIEKITTNILNREAIEIPVQGEDIVFKGWTEKILNIESVFMTSSRNLLRMQLDAETFKIELI